MEEKQPGASLQIRFLLTPVARRATAGASGRARRAPTRPPAAREDKESPRGRSALSTPHSITCPAFPSFLSHGREPEL